MTEQKFSTVWGRIWQNNQGPARRKSRATGILMETMELLEVRQVLSAVATVPLAADVVTTQETTDKSTVSVAPAVTPTYPDLTGTWSISMSGVFDGDPIGPFDGTVSITQKNGKIKGVVSVPGLPDFKLKGKLDKENVLDLSGRVRFPYEFKPDRFFRIGLSIDLTYAMDHQSFTGTFHRSIFGHDIDGTVTGNKV